MAKAKPVQKKKMSKPALAAVIISIIMLLALALSLIAGSGFFFRIKKGASTERFEVNASMLEYYATSYMQNWYSQNYYYILLGYIKFDDSVPLNEQYTDTSKTQTYYDYFVEGAKTTVSTYLKYCEAAMDDSSVNFDELESAAEQYAKDSIKQLKEAAQKYSDSYYAQTGHTISFNEYIRQNFGEHVNKNDLKKALIIEHIASSYYEIVHDRIHDGISEIREDKYFEDNLSTFVTAEYLIYTLSSKKTVVWPKAEDYVGGKDSAAYKAKIEGMKAEEAAKINVEDYDGGEDSVAYKADYKTAEENKKANEESLAEDYEVIKKLSEAKTAEEYKEILLNEKFDTAFESAFNTATNKFESKDKLSTDARDLYMTEEFKKAFIDAVISTDANAAKVAEKLKEFKTEYLNTLYEDSFKAAYDAAIEGIKAEDKPTEAALEAFVTAYNTEALKNAIIDAVVNGKETVDEASIVIPEGTAQVLIDVAKALPKAVIVNVKNAAVKEIQLEFLADRYVAHFDSAYNAAIKGWATEEKPSDDIIKAFKNEELKQAIINAVINGEENVDESLLVFPEGATDKWKEAAKDLPKTIIKSLKSGADKWVDAAKAIPTTLTTNLVKVITDATKTTSYTLTSVLGNKLFGGVKAEYEIEYEDTETEGTTAAANTAWIEDVLAMNLENFKISKKITEAAIAELVEEIAKETDSEKKTALESQKKTLEESIKTVDERIKSAEEKIANVEKTSEYSYSAYFVTEAAHRDDTKVRNVGHILFKVDEKGTNGAYKTKEEAKAAAEKLYADIKAACVDGKISKEKFEEFGKVTHDSNVFYDDVTKDQMVKEFEDWLFNATTEGEIGLIESDYGWHIMYYGGASGETAWRITAHEGATNEDLGEWFEALPYTVTINEELFPQIFGLDHDHDHNHDHNH